MLLAALRGRFIFLARRDYVVFTIDVCCSVLTRQRVYCLLGQSPCSPQVEDVGLVLMNTVGLGYQNSMVCSTSLAVDKAGNLVTIGRFQSLSFFTVSAGSFFLSSGLAPQELQLCWILWPKDSWNSRQSCSSEGCMAFSIQRRGEECPSEYSAVPSQLPWPSCPLHGCSPQLPLWPNSQAVCCTVGCSSGSGYQAASASWLLAPPWRVKHYPCNQPDSFYTAAWSW